jgi:hypothetical protein
MLLMTMDGVANELTILFDVRYMTLLCHGDMVITSPA